MKANRYLNPDRHLDHDMGRPDMEDPHAQHNAPLESGSDGDAPTTLEVDVGKAMPATPPTHLPLLQTAVQATPMSDPPTGGQDRSMIAEGLHFVGNALLHGPCSVAGLVEGNLTQASGAVVAVVVTETGQVKGDITAQKISVMGRTEGILDAGQGEVALHDTASVHGLVRYGRIQVNGADLNATLERAALQKPGT